MNGALPQLPRVLHAFADRGRFSATTAGIRSLFAELTSRPELWEGLWGVGASRWVVFLHPGAVRPQEVAQTDTAQHLVTPREVTEAPGEPDDLEFDVFLPRIPLSTKTVTMSLTVHAAPEPRLVGGTEILSE